MENSTFEVYFVVMNGSSKYTITDVKVYSDDSGGVTKINQLKPGEVSQERQRIYQNGNQEWFVTYTINNRYHKFSHECGFRSADNKHVATIILYHDNFSMITPISSNCRNKTW